MFFITGVLLLAACNENPDTVLQPPHDYFPLSVGNYWIYDHYEVMETGEETLTGRRDSIYIEKVKLIGSDVYYIIKGSRFLCGHFFTSQDYQVIRDSSGYLINENGSVFMSSVCFGETLNEFADTMPDGDTLYSGIYSMQTEPAEVSVPAGSFDVINCRVKITVFEEDERKVRYSDNLFAEDVGEVLDSYFYLSQTDRHYEKRLVCYQVASD